MTFDIQSKLFDRLVAKDNGCLEFTGALDTGRYGIVWKEGRNRGAHILTYEHHNGPIPEHLCVLHKCDNPPCCNQEHLFLGTKKDNFDDMVFKGRDVNYFRKGAEINTSVLTEVDVLEVYSLIDEGQTQRKIAELYGVTHTAIGYIARGRSWKHLFEEHGRGRPR